MPPENAWDVLKRLSEEVEKSDMTERIGLEPQQKLDTFHQSWILNHTRLQLDQIQVKLAKIEKLLEEIQSQGLFLMPSVSSNAK